MRRVHFTHPVIIAATSSLLWLTGCIAPLKPAKVPMPTLDLHLPEVAASGEDSASPEAPCAVVFLPGSFDQPRVFDRHAFDDVLSRRHPGIRTIAADAHMGYYRRRTVLDRLVEDVVQPLRQDGYRVWLAGISLGGLGTLLYAKEHGDDPRLGIEGLVTMAPFLGNDQLIDEITAAGGPLHWQPPSEVPPRGRKSVGYELWPWLAQWHGRAANERPEIILAYGLRDDFAPAGELLASLLDEDRVFTHPAGHDWDAWTPLWRAVVEAGTFDGCQQARQSE